jgi:hypothetical protein
MATLYISEYESLALDNAGRTVQIVKEAAITTQTVTPGATHTESSAFNARTRFVRIHTDTACTILFGASPVATATNGPRLAADQTEIFGVSGGMKLSCIT